MGTNKVENGNKSWHETGMINSTLHAAEMLCLFIRIAWLKSRCLINKGEKMNFCFQDELKKWPAKNQNSLYGGPLHSGLYRSIKTITGPLSVYPTDTQKKAPN